MTPRKGQQLTNVSSLSRLGLEDAGNGKDFYTTKSLYCFLYWQHTGTDWMDIEEVFIPAGFMTDLASTPPGIPKLTRGNRWYVFHDYGYRRNRERLTRAQWDRVMLLGLLDDGMSKWKAYGRYGAVRAFGWKAWNKHADARRLFQVKPS